MFKRLLEAHTGKLSNSEFHEVMDLAATDIKINRIGFRQRTNLSEAVEIAKRCYVALRRTKNAA